MQFDCRHGFIFINTIWFRKKLKHCPLLGKTNPGAPFQRIIPDTRIYPHLQYSNTSIIYIWRPISSPLQLSNWTRYNSFFSKRVDFFIAEILRGYRWKREKFKISDHSHTMLEIIIHIFICILSDMLTVYIHIYLSIFINHFMLYHSLIMYSINIKIFLEYYTFL